MHNQPATTAGPVLLTVDQTADRLNTTVRFVRRLIAERRIPYHKIGRHVRVAEADLDRLIAAGRIEASR
jgi:excisionase family DNA binding protein